MLRFTSRSSTSWRVPVASIAESDEPYSTIRCSPRWYQLMLGISDPAGCWPVTSADRHTGVSDGKVETHASVRRPSPASQSMVGATPAAFAWSSSSGPSPSITVRISFFGRSARRPTQRSTRRPSYF